MWMLALLRRWYAVSSLGGSVKASIAARTPPWSVQIYWIARLLRRQLKEWMHRTPPNPYSVFLQGKLSDLAELNDLRRFCEDGHLVRWFSTEMRGTGLSEQSAINQEIIDISQQAREASPKGLLNKYQFLVALDRFQDVLLRHRHDVNHVNVVTMLHRMGSMAKDVGMHPGATHELLLRELLDVVEVHVSVLKPRHVSNVVWALGKMRLQMSSSNSAWTAWEPLLHQLVEHGVQRIHEFWPRNVSNILLGLAYLENRNCRPFLPVLVAQAKVMLHHFSPQELSNTIWGLAMLHYIDRQNFLFRLLRRAEGMIDEFTPQQMAVILWSLAAFHYIENESIIESIVEILGSKECHSQSLAVVLWSLSQLFIRPTDEQIGRLLEECPGFAQPPRSIEQVRDHCMILVALADFGYRSPRRMKLSLRLREVLDVEPIIFAAQDICNFIWALVIMDNPILTPGLLDLMFSRLQRIGLETLRDEDIRQFYQGILHIKAFKIRDPEFTVLPVEIEQRWKAIWCVRQTTSPLPLWVAAALVVMERMGHKCQGRFLEQGLINTCILDLDDNFKYAVEGISFVRSFRKPLAQTTGRYRWKVRLLEVMGYEVLRIEEGEWEKRVHLDAKKSYLQGKIDEARANTMNRIKAIRPP